MMTQAFGEYVGELCLQGQWNWQVITELRDQSKQMMKN